MAKASINTLIIQNIGKKRERARELAKLEKELNELMTKREALEDLVKNLERTDEIYRGIALWYGEGGRSLDIGAVDYAIRRYAHIYANAHSNKEAKLNGAWCVRVHEYPEPGALAHGSLKNGGVVFGLGPNENNPRQLNKNEAVKRAKDWVAKGIMPKEKDE